MISENYKMIFQRCKGVPRFDDEGKSWLLPNAAVGVPANGL
jgi:hypothetical protein